MEKNKKSLRNKIVIMVGVLFVFIVVGAICLTNKAYALPSDLEYTPGDISVTGLQINKTIDGTEPFDGVGALSALDPNADGNDGSDSNKRIRAQDDLTYNLSYVVAINDTNVETGKKVEVKSVSNAKLYFAVHVDATSTEALFVTDSMTWLKGAKVVEDSTGQTLIGYRVMPQNEAGVSVPGAGTVSVTIRPLKKTATNTITPTITSWIDNGTEEEKSKVPDTNTVSVVSDTITVTSSVKLNVGLVSPAQNGNLGYYDNTTYEYHSEACANCTYGMLYTFGLYHELYNEVELKGLRGVEAATEPITVDLTFDSYYQPVSVGSYSKYSIDPKVVDVGINMDEQYGIKNTNFYSGAIRSIPFSATAGHISSFYTPYNAPMEGYSATINGNKISITIDDYKITTFPSINVDNNKTYGANEGIFNTSKISVFQPIVPITETTNFRVDGIISSIGYPNLDSAYTNLNKKDDKASASMATTVPGLYSLQVSNFVLPGGNLLSSNAFSGDGNVANGNNFYQATTSFLVNGFPKIVKSGDILLKFDNEGFEIQPSDDGEYNTILNWNLDRTYFKNKVGGTQRLLYAAKPDKNGWKNFDEMKLAQEKDLVFFSSLKELTDAGYICVGTMFELRNVNISYDLATYFATEFGYLIPLHAKESAINKETYGIVPGNELWFTDQTGKSYINGGTDPDYITGKENSNKEVILNDIGLAWYPSDYTKTTYDDQGNVTGGNNGSYWQGNTVRIVDFTANISKKVAQTSNDAVKQVFDLEGHQRYVDYDITYRTSGAASSSKPLTITDTLPKGQTYVTNSAKVDGEYSQDAKANGGAGGTYTGTALEPTITVNGDGTTTLVWNVTTEIGTIHDIYYRTILGDEDNPANDLNNNDSLTNTVTISGDSRPVAANYGNIATSTIKVQKLSSIQLAKQTDKQEITANGSYNYSISMTNTNNVDMTNMKFLDILPYNGDKYETHYDGTYKVTSVSIDKTKANTSNVELYYTTNDKIKEQTNAKDIDVTDTSLGLTKVVGTTSGNIVTYVVPEDIKAIVITGMLAGQSELKLNVGITTNGNKGGDTYYNKASIYGDGMPTYLPTPPVEVKVGTTIWIENITENDLGGKVSAVDTKLNNVSSGERVAGNNVSYEPDEKWIVNYSNIKINGETATYDKDKGTLTGKDKNNKTLVGTLSADKKKITFEDMTTNIDVGVEFIPTIYIENETANDEGGTVNVKDKTASKVASQRETSNVVEMTPDEGYRIKTIKINIVAATLEGNNITAGNATGTITTTNGKTTVTIENMKTPVDVAVIYEKIPAQVITHHYLKGTTTKLSADETQNGHIKDNYTTSSVATLLDHYTVTEPANKTGTMDKELTEVTYYYEPKEYTLTVHHYVEGTTTSLSPDETSTKKYDEAYETNAEEYDDYEYVSVDGTPNGKITENTVVTYYYKLKEGSKIIVNYKDDKGKVISPSDDYCEGQEVTSDCHAPCKDIKDYTVTTEPPYFDKKITLEVQEVTCIYTKNPGEPVDITYIDTEGNEIAGIDTVCTGEKIGYNCNTTCKTIEGYITKTIPLDKDYTLTSEKQERQCVYEKRKVGTVIAIYQDESGNKLTENVNQSGYVDDKYTTDEKKFSGYELIEVPLNKDGIYTEKEIIVIYVYKKVNNPFTGDSNIIPLIVVTLGSLSVIGSAIYFFKKRKISK